MIRTTPRRCGTILPLLAVTCFALFGFVALAVDLGMMMVARTECQNAADTAALSGARTLDNDFPDGVTAAQYDNKRPQAIVAATNSVKANYLLKDLFAFNDTAVDKVEIGIYDYDTTATIFKTTFPAANATDPSAKINGRPWTACRVTVKGDQPTYFARIFGITSMPMLARATAVHRPRDIAMVLDFSGSMKFGCIGAYPPGNGGSNGAIIGMLSPDPRYPQFGHYQRYDGRQTTNPNGTNQHPFQTTNPYTMSGGEICSPNNHTWESSGGPPMVEDYYMNPSTDPAAAVNPTSLVKAFNNPTYVVTPLPQTYNTQSVTGIVGDRWPRRGGFRDTTATQTSWNPTGTTVVGSTTHYRGAARNAAELLFLNGNFPGTATARTIPNGRPALANGNRTEGSTAWDSWRDDGWERNGYDLDIATYVSSNYATANTRTTENFTGYTMGPGYWGKTFFVWPPDPRFDSAASLTSPRTGTTYQNTPAFDTSGRAMCDWRRRFFLRGDGTPFDPQAADNNTAVAGSQQSINSALLDITSGGHVLSETNTYFRVNYPAVLAWLKAGPQTLPRNLRAGRILFYAKIPDDCTNPRDEDERFWREYIDYTLGVTRNRTWYNPAYCLAGTETGGAWGTFRNTATCNTYDPDGGGTQPANPRPYMDYRDTPNMPRAHFWFGPTSMLMFVATRGQFTGSKEWNWNPGTVREAQSWQLKAAIQSSIDDIRKNHPNDQVGMAFFAHSNFRTPRVTMGQDWERLKASLFFPSTFLNDVVAGNVREERPYDTSFSSRLVGNIPNANGATDPNNGLAQAYNMLSSSNASGAGGRRGAAKIVIFETDGVPNSYQDWNFSSSGTNSQYTWASAGSNVGNGDPGIMQDAYDVVTQICASTTAANPGFSLPNTPARVYPFGFGDLFSSGSSFRPTAETFLQTIAFYGKTSASSSTPLPAGQIITGSYATRIDTLRSGLERVLQSGVQVTLVE